MTGLHTDQDTGQTSRFSFLTSSLKVRLVAVFLLISILPMAVVAWLGYQQSSDALKDEANAKLTAIREIKKSQIEGYFGTIQGQAQTLAMNSAVITSETEFNEAFRSLTGELATDGLSVDGSSLDSYYTNEFGPTYSANGGSTRATSFVPTDESVRAAVGCITQVIRNEKAPGLGTRRFSFNFSASARLTSLAFQSSMPSCQVAKRFDLHDLRRHGLCRTCPSLPQPTA